MSIRIDQDKCLRWGMCTGIAMDVFNFDDEGNIEVNEEKVNEENKDSIEDAINSCPVGAISKDEEEE